MIRNFRRNKILVNIAEVIKINLKLKTGIKLKSLIIYDDVYQRIDGNEINTLK